MSKKHFAGNLTGDKSEAMTSKMQAKIHTVLEMDELSRSSSRNNQSLQVLCVTSKPRALI